MLSALSDYWRIFGGDMTECPEEKGGIILLKGLTWEKIIIITIIIIIIIIIRRIKKINNTSSLFLINN